MFRDLLNEDSPVSMLRLMSLISLVTGCGLAIYGIYVGRDLLGLSALCGVFVTAAFTGKVIQKSMEGVK